MSQNRGIEEDEILFEEVQKFRQIWIWILVACCVAAGVLTLISVPWSDGIAGISISFFAPLVGFGIAVLIYMAKLRVVVYRDHLFIHYRPFLSRKIAYDNIKTVKAETYSPIGEFGGWGVRGWGSNKAYNVSGNKGVRLTFIDDKRLLIGSQKADELAQAIELAQSF